MASQTTYSAHQKVIADHLKDKTYVIELHMFSGRPNPTVGVHESEEHHMKKFHDHTSFQSTRLASTLGYRGFIVHKRTSPKGASLETSRLTVGRGNDAALERSLLQMFPDLSEHLTDHVKERYEAGPLSSEIGGVKPEEVSTMGWNVFPSYNPDTWNNNPIALKHNNCYNYSTNDRTDTFAQPGRCHGLIMHRKTITAKQVLSGCIQDGLIERPDGKPPSPTGNTVPIALVIWPSFEGSTNPDGHIEDFHFYRMDSNQMWSHKPGDTPVTNMDNSGNWITDPKSADRGSYTYFLGYLGIPGVEIK